MEAGCAGERAPGMEGYPHFIIIGAQKSGTSSVHEILAHHERVFIPDREIFFFDVDDVEQHPDFFVRTRDGWTVHDFEADLERYQSWYLSLFAEARPDQLRGEDSTTYLASKVAPARIARLAPDVKLIAMLRDPVARAHSHYWHTVSTGRATMTFEDTLRYRPANLIARGCYAEQLERYLAHFTRERLHVVLFEQFVQDRQSVVDRMCEYLGLDHTVDLSAVQSHRNAATAPLSLRGRLLANRLLRPVLEKSYRGRMPNMPGHDPSSARARMEGHPLARKAARAYEAIKPRRPYPPMQQETREFLEKLFCRLNARLPEIIYQDVARYWPYMR